MQPSKTAIACLICRHPDLETVSENRSFGVPINRCPGCGFVQSGYVSAAALKTYYSDLYRSRFSRAEIALLEEKTRAQADSQTTFMEEMQGEFHFENVLEVGASDGQLAKQLKRRAQKMYVTEADPQYARLLAAAPELEFLEEAELVTGRFDAGFDFIAVSHVLEHLADPLAAIEQFSRLLKKDGFLLVDLPNEAELTLTTAFQAKGHLWFFSPQTFKTLIHTHGKFDIQEMRTCNRSIADFIAADFKLEEEYSRLKTENGTVIRTLLQNVRPAAALDLRPGDHVNPRLLMDAYSREMVKKHHQIMALKRRLDAAEKTAANAMNPGINPKKPFDAKSAPPVFERLNFDFSKVGKSGFCLDLDLAQFSQRMIYDEARKTGLYERETSIVMGSLLAQGDMAIDVGAHIGYFSLLASMMVEAEGKVFSFEPIDENLQHLRHHLAQNRAFNVTSQQMVVGHRTGSTRFYFNRDNDGGHALWDVGAHQYNQKSRLDPRPLTLPMTSLDEYFAAWDLTRLKMIKIDTEGNELNVLRGAERILKRYRVGCVVCELNKFGLQQMGHTQKDLQDFMEGLGYARLIFMDDGLKRMTPDQFIKSNDIINLFFIPREQTRGLPLVRTPVANGATHTENS